MAAHGRCSQYSNQNRFPSSLGCLQFLQPFLGNRGIARHAHVLKRLLRFAEQNRLMVTIPVASLAEWLEVKRRLEDVASVVASDLAYMTRDSVDLMITYVGNENQLSRALARKDLVLTQDRNQGWWKLTLNAALPRPDNQPGVE